ncbi:MAG: hypothetical protein V4539_07580 [Bacteroidota bacterium]
MNLLLSITYKLRTMLFASLLFCSVANSQVTTGKLEEQFNRYGESVLQEKLYMHVDRNFYLAGDIMWCKLYVVDASLHQPLDVSKVAYVEVLNEHNTPVIQAKMSLDKGKGNGSLSLPINITSGNYKLRAYTNWMKNAGPDYFFEKTITIVNAQKSRELTKPSNPTTATPEIRFFPEGGNLVTGINSKVACKVSAADGTGIAFNGTIVDENNNAVVNFRSLKFGMGSFSFTPGNGHKYKAVIEVGNAKFTQNLPEIFNRGYVMQLTAATNTSLTVTVQTNLEDTGRVFLLAHTRQSLRMALQANFVKGKAVFTVDPNKLDGGISQLAIINSKGKPVCERLYFTYPSQNLSIKISGRQPVYSTRSKIDLAVQALTEKGKEKDPDMSVAVYRLDELQTIDESNIQTFLWLSSDLKGRIESPGYYFGNNTAEILPVMDNLMLTQGWRRFKWDDVVQDKIPALSFAPEHNGHIITGRVVSTVTGKPIDNVETYLSVPGLNTNFRVYISDSSGQVKFDFAKMKGSTEIIVQTNPTAADTLSRVEINNPFSEQYTATHLSPFFLSYASEKSLLDQSIGVQVQGVYSGNKIKHFIQNNDTSSILEKPDDFYLMDDFTRFTTIEEVLREYVGLMDVQKTKKGFSIYLINDFFVPSPAMEHTDFFQAEPLILVDGVPIFNVDRLMGYDPLKMRKVEVYNKRYFLGRSFFSGILNWTSYKGDLANFELDPHALVIDYEGMQAEREFYSPSYDSTSQATDHTPDFRTLLYWSHEIKADPNGEHHVRFYTSDKKGNYVAVIQGLTPAGYCGSALVPFEVK